MSTLYLYVAVINHRCLDDKTLGLLVCYSTDGHHLPKEIPDECDMTFICEKFEGKVFNYLKQKGFRLMLI